MRVVPGFDEFEDRDPGFELCLETMTVEMRWEGGKRTGEESNFEFTFRRGPVFFFSVCVGIRTQSTAEPRRTYRRAREPSA